VHAEPGLTYQGRPLPRPQDEVVDQGLAFDGRWPHIHFEVYPTQADVTDAGKTIATSQVALPKKVCDTVYAQPGYEQSVSNLNRVSLSSDNVFEHPLEQQSSTRHRTHSTTSFTTHSSITVVVAIGRRAHGHGRTGTRVHPGHQAHSSRVARPA
jgi:hypothetical protein